MRLNLPILDELLACENLLIAGMGGGFDVFCGLPIYFELRRLGRTVHLANLSFTNLQFIKDATPVGDFAVGVGPQSRSVLLYAPEMHLAHFLDRQRGDPATVWCLRGAAGGALGVTAAYRAVAEHLGIDGLLLIDGGVDSLSRGDEAEVGTILEDTYSLAAIRRLDGLKVCALACLGFGAEREVTHAHLLENVAALTEAGAFLGACALTPQMESFRGYADAVEYAHARRGQDPSVINASVVSAVRGGFGDVHATEKTRKSRLWINPLMGLYWFFDAPAVAERSLYVPALADSATRLEALSALSRVRDRTPVRAAPTVIPLQ